MGYRWFVAAALSLAGVVSGADAARAQQVAVEFFSASLVYERAAQVYRSIWDDYGERIVTAFEARTCMPFSESWIGAEIDEAVSHSGGPEHPMRLRASYAIDMKKSTLVHELGHRHLWQLEERLDEVDGHRTLYLILDRVWADVWGERFAEERVQGESAWRSRYDYAAAWSWARSLGTDERERLWRELLSINGYSADCTSLSWLP